MCVRMVYTYFEKGRIFLIVLSFLSLFGWRLSQYQDVNALVGQGIPGELGAVWTGFRVIQLVVSQCATDRTEADNVVHVDDHGEEEEEFLYGVVIIGCAVWLGAVALCRVEECPEGWDVVCVVDQDEASVNSEDRFTAARNFGLGLVTYQGVVVRLRLWTVGEEVGVVPEHMFG